MAVGAGTITLVLWKDSWCSAEPSPAQSCGLEQKSSSVHETELCPHHEASVPVNMNKGLACFAAPCFTPAHLTASVCCVVSLSEIQAFEKNSNICAQVRLTVACLIADTWQVFSVMILPQVSLC